MYGTRSWGTFSIAACDPDRAYWGVAVSTKPLAVGAVVPWTEWRVGAIATQAMSNYQYGPSGLTLLRKGLSAEEVIARLTRADSKRQHRQLGVVDRNGRSAAWTGKKCMASAGHVLGDGFSCQGNLLASDTVVPAMASAFESARGSLARRMLAALRAGAAEGGDRRGMESAALVVVHRRPWFERAWGDQWLNLRVDQHRKPITELERLVTLEEANTRKFLRWHADQERRRRAKRRRG
ncbi:MAG TPA: DUF1028 domain-containing protein [Thermoplasmata archaeon]|nr:DUF1028 domain-containing protein [Thermoplasmata archaeon]